MKVENKLHPGDQQAAEFFSDIDNDQPVYMVNLLKFKVRAAYEDGRDTDLTGQEAYALYVDGLNDGVLESVGAKVVLTGCVTGLLVGDVDELWDDVAVAMYPNKAAMMQMFTSSEYQKIHIHRQAGLAGQLNLSVNAADQPIF